MKQKEVAAERELKQKSQKPHIKKKKNVSSTPRKQEYRETNTM